MSIPARVESFLDLALTRKTLAGMCIGTMVLAPADYVWISMRNKVVPVLAGAGSNHLPGKSSLEPLAAYQAVFEQSMLFGNLNAKGSGPVIGATMAERVKDFRLKGVVIGREPEAILEDAGTQQSVFVRKGQRVGDLEVKDIEEGYVVVGHLGEEARLQIQ